MDKNALLYYRIKFLNVIAKTIGNKPVVSKCYFCHENLSVPTRFLVIPTMNISAKCGEFFISHSSPSWIYLVPETFAHRSIPFSIKKFCKDALTYTGADNMKFLMHENCLQTWELLPNEHE